jgi:hypothetical protein
MKKSALTKQNSKSKKSWISKKARSKNNKKWSNKKGFQTKRVYSSNKKPLKTGKNLQKLQQQYQNFLVHANTKNKSQTTTTRYKSNPKRRV